MKRFILWIILLLSLSAPVKAVLINNSLGRNLTAYYSFDVNGTDNGNNTYDLTKTGSFIQSGAVLFNGSNFRGTSGEFYTASQALTSGNKSFSFWLNTSDLDPPSKYSCVFMTSPCGGGATTGGIRSSFTTDAAPDASYTVTVTSPASYIQLGTRIIGVNGSHHFVIRWDDTNDNLTLYIDGKLNATAFSVGFNEGNPNNNLRIGEDYTANDYALNGMLDEFGIWNRTLTDGGNCSIGDVCGGEVWSLYHDPDDGANFFNGTTDPPIHITDITPPEITYFNLTNDNVCENWNTDKNNACITSAATPTVQFNTSESAWCRIAGSTSPTALNLNYTDMGESRNCTGAGAGEGDVYHRCILINPDTLVYDKSYIFISCRDSQGNQNKSSTSGALAVNVTGLEAAARSSINLGIQNSLLNSYSIYTDQRVYARNSANTQQVSVFDKVVKKLSKIWAFNYIGISDVSANMLNITPVFYNFEFSNKTSVYIENQTAFLINSTK